MTWNLTLSIEILLGGIFVLYSYYWASLQPNAPSLWAGLSHYRYLWIVSGLLTAFSFLFISLELCQKTTLIEPIYTYLCFLCILIPSAFWAWVTLRIQHWLLVGYVLWLCAAGSIGLFVLLLQYNQISLTLCGIMLLIQHVGLDGLLWYFAFLLQ
tara:strand:+ start:54 stop:518 length:465 start_codon:yes stop_codon:yes gene_type:complete